MTIKRSEISRKKMEMLDIYIVSPTISNAAMAQRLGTDQHTVAKWKKEWETKLATVKLNIEQQITEEIAKKGTLFQQITDKIQGLFN